MHQTNIARVFAALIGLTLIASTGFLTGPASAQSLNRWEVSCGADPGSIQRSRGTWVFSTSRNYCTGGTFNQRAEIFTEDYPTNRSGAFMFSTTTSFTTPTNNEFSIFSIHDGRNGCAPPLQLFVREDGRMYIASDIKTGPGESCIRGTIGGTSPARVKRDGTEQLLEVLVQFDGSGGFRSVVWLDGAVQIDGRYAPSQRPDAILSSRFYFKHGVYSKRVFPYTLRSTDMGVRRVRVN